MTTKDDNKKHKTQPRMTRHHIPYSHTYHNDKRTHKEDVHTQNKITHTNTHTRTKTSNRRQKSKCDNKNKPQIFKFSNIDQSTNKL
jgi:hypothetical protein